MNIDNLHDALGLLDDDLIEEVDNLRNEKKQILRPHRGKIWIRWVAIAACLCFVIGSIYITDGFHLMSSKGSGASKDAATEVAGVEEQETEEDGTDVTDAMTNTGSENENECIEIPSVLVEIVSWDENGFTGTVTGIVDTEKYPVGTAVNVKVSADNGTTYEESIPDSTDFPVGSVVCVQFTKSESESDMVVLYAETISLNDSE